MTPTPVTTEAPQMNREKDLHTVGLESAPTLPDNSRSHLASVPSTECPQRFRYIDRGGHDCWLHDSGAMWIVRYEAVPGGREYDVFHAFRVVAKLPKGRDPWTVDNRRLSPEPFRSLNAAAEAVYAIAKASGAERRATDTPSASAPKDHDQGSDEK